MGLMTTDLGSLKVCGLGILGTRVALGVFPCLGRDYYEIETLTTEQRRVANTEGNASWYLMGKSFGEAYLLSFDLYILVITSGSWIVEGGEGRWEIR